MYNYAFKYSIRTHAILLNNLIFYTKQSLPFLFNLIYFEIKIKIIYINLKCHL